MSDEDEIEYSDEDEDGYDDEDGGKVATPFDQETQGRLVAGRLLDLGGMTAGALTAFKLAVDALAERTGLPLEVVPGGDFTETGPSQDDAVHGDAVIGLPAGRGGPDGPSPLHREPALERLATARGISAAVWEEIAALLPEGRRARLLAEDIDLWLVCVGPLAAATLAFGVEGGEEDEDMPGEFLRGQDMDQEPFDTGVWGLRVEYVQYEGPEAVRVDLSDEAHAANVAELGRSDGGYFIISRYD